MNGSNKGKAEDDGAAQPALRANDELNADAEVEAQIREMDDRDQEAQEPTDPEMVERAMEEMPPEVRQTFLGMMMRSTSGPVPHPLLGKLNEEHIHKLLDYTRKDGEDDFHIRSSNRWFALVYTILGLGVFLFLVIFLLPGNKDVLVDLLKLLVAFAGGVGGGVGLKSYWDRK